MPTEVDSYIERDSVHYNTHMYIKQATRQDYGYSNWDLAHGYMYGIMLLNNNTNGIIKWHFILLFYP